MIKAVIFDLGRVIVDIQFENGLLGYLSMADADTLQKLGKDENFIAFSTGMIEPDKFYKVSREKYNFDLSYDEFTRLWCNIFSEKKGIREIIDKVRKRYPIGLLSDTDPLHWNHITSSIPWIAQYFSNPVLSYRIKCMKPHMDTYRHAAEAVGAAAHECLFIDDLEKNIAGAENAGMSGIVFSDITSLSRKLQEYEIITP